VLFGVALDGGNGALPNRRGGLEMFKKKLVHIGLESKSNLLVALPLVEDIQ